MVEETPVRILDLHTDEPQNFTVPPVPPVVISPEVTTVNTNKQQIEHVLDLWFNRHFRGPMMAGESDFWVIAQSARIGLSSIVKGI